MPRRPACIAVAKNPAFGEEHAPGCSPVVCRAGLHLAAASAANASPHHPPNTCLQQMTYVKQLEDYEEAVMRKRLEEMPEAGELALRCPGAVALRVLPLRPTSKHGRVAALPPRVCGSECGRPQMASAAACVRTQLLHPLLFPPAEMERMLEEVEAEKAARAAARQQRQQQQQQQGSGPQ